MPKLFEYGEYIVYFWSNEEGEPVHVHVAVRRPSEHATKVWLTSSGGCVLASNDGRISSHDLGDLLEIIALNYDRICDRWRSAFGNERLSFYR
jgi:hypothetical protein